MSKVENTLLSFVIFSCAAIYSTAVSATVDGKGLSRLLEVSETVPLTAEYRNGCIFSGRGASVEYWYVLKAKTCQNTIGNVGGREQRLDRLIEQGKGFSIRTVCTSTGTQLNCEGKPIGEPFDFQPAKVYLGRCIRYVKRLNGYSGVYCIKGLQKEEADSFLNTLMKSKSPIERKVPLPVNEDRQ